MSKKYHKNIEKQLIDIVNSHSNENKCGECATPFPTWASWNLGILLCGRCASVHRKCIPQISKVKSLTLDQWSPDQIENLRRIGNKRAKKDWNPRRVPFPYADDDDQGPIEEYLREKYVEGKYRDDDVDPRDYHLGGDHDSLAPPRSASRASSRSRSSSIQNGGSRSRGNTSSSGSGSRGGGRPIPRLSHRRVTKYEESQYQTELRNVLRLGYQNSDAILEALCLSEGDLDLALDILDEDKKVNPTEEELPPALPRRPRNTSYSDNNPIAAMVTGQQPQQQPTQSTNEWWTQGSAQATGQQQQQQQLQTGAATGQQPQIYQYTDPATGQISYIDSNGQQYLDPSNPQHQQQLMQQQQAQQVPLTAQQTTNQAILSLYGQPDRFTTNVVAPVDGKQQPQQQPQQQQQPTGFGFQQQQQQPTGFGFQQQQPTGYAFQQQQPTGYAFQQQQQQPTGYAFQQGGQPNGYQFQGQQQYR